jgi:PCO_ADO
MLRRHFLFAAGLSGTLAWCERVLANAELAQATDHRDTLEALRSATMGLLPAETDEKQSAYVYGLASAAVRFKPPQSKLFEMGEFAPGIRLGPMARTTGLIAIGYEATPGAKMPPHNHPNYSVVTLGLRGYADVRNFDAAQAPPMTSPIAFSLPETRHLRLGPGDVTTLTPTRDNIHTFVAGPEGAMWVDFTTAHGPDIGFSYLSMQSTQPADRSALARWWKPS